MRGLLGLLLVSLTSTLFAQADQLKSFQDEEKQWFKTHPPPKPNASPEEQQAFREEVARASAAWVEHWPEDPRAWRTRLQNLARVKSTSNQQVQEVGETLLKVAKEHPVKGYLFVPFQIEVAKVWSERNIDPERCIQLAQEGVLESERSQNENPSTAQEVLLAVARGLFDAFDVELGEGVKLKKFDVARSAVDQMKRWTDAHPGFPGSGYILERYLSAAAWEAETEGHKLDALMYYSRALPLSPENASLKTHVAALWKELGGTDEGFQALTSLAKEQQPSPEAVVPWGSHWTPMNKSLAAFQGTDLNGKLWTASDLKGKTTVVNVWAIWCRPCQDELPMVQKLFDELKDRANTQVLTVSTDENLASIPRFASRLHYTFPIIPISSEMVDKMAGVAAIPRTWIVDSTGSLRFEMVGYEPPQWPDQILEMLAKVK